MADVLRLEPYVHIEDLEARGLLESTLIVCISIPLSILTSLLPTTIHQISAGLFSGKAARKLRRAVPETTKNGPQSFARVEMMVEDQEMGNSRDHQTSPRRVPTTMVSHTGASIARARRAMAIAMSSMVRRYSSPMDFSPD